MAKSKPSGTRIDKTSLFIASLAPLLWVIDSYRGALLLNESFVKQLLFPASSEFLLRLWLVFFIFIQAWFFSRYSRATGGESEIREKFTLLFELAQDVLVITDTEGKVRQASRSAERFWGYSLEQLLTLDLTLLCPEGEAEKLTGFIRQIARDKTGRLDNVVLSGKDGKQILSDINARFIDGASGGNKPGIFLDISQRGSGAALAEPEAAVVPAPAVLPVPAPEVIPAPQVEIPRVDLEQERGKIEEAVRQQEAAKSQQAIKALEQRYLEIMKQRLAEECKKVEETVRQEEKKKAEELGEAVSRQEAVKSQEAIKVLEQRYNQILNSRVAEERRQVEELVRQEENKKSEARVRELEAKFSRDSGEQISEGRKLIEESVRREEQKIAEEKAQELKREVEQKYTQILNARIEEARQLEQKNSEQKAAELRQRYEELLRKATEDERKRQEEALVRERVRVEEAVKQQEAVKFQEALRELEKKHAEALKVEAAKVSVQKVSEAAQSKPPEISRVVRGISQQMMNPLSAVLNQLKLIKIKFTQGGELKPNEFKDTVDLIEENALLCRSILSSLSETGRGVKVSFQPVSLNNLISRIDGLMGQELKLQNITVTKQLDASVPEISGDPLLLTQVVFNLLANSKWAIKSNAYGAPGTILIRTSLSAQKDSVSLEITDNGIGISEQNLPRIFEPFFTTKPDCLGLGLSVAENIVKAHKGQIQVESKEGGGATFRVILPTVN